MLISVKGVKGVNPVNGVNDMEMCSNCNRWEQANKGIHLEYYMGSDKKQMGNPWFCSVDCLEEWLEHLSNQVPKMFKR